MLGCSFTHGWAISDEETFSWLVQEEFPQIKVINWGMSGFGTIHFYLQLKEALAQRKPPAIIIINHADFHIQRNIFTYQRQRAIQRWNFLGSTALPLATLNEKGEITILHDNSGYHPWLLSKFSSIVYYLQQKYETYLDNQELLKGQKITELILNEILLLCSRNNIIVGITNIIGESSFPKNYAQQHDIPFVDISVDPYDPSNNNLPYDSHSSAFANKIYAQKMHHLITALYRNTLLK